MTGLARGVARSCQVGRGRELLGRCRERTGREQQREGEEEEQQQGRRLTYMHRTSSVQDRCGFGH